MDESISNEWKTIHKNRGWGNYPSEPVIRFMARNFYHKDRQNVRVLDFGCGQGAHTWYLAREGFDTYAFDGAPAAVEKAKLFIDKEGLKASIDVMDGIHVSYEKNFFDAVIDNACVGHNSIENIKAMYLEIFDIIKDGGMLFTSFFSINTTGYGTGTYIGHDTYKNVENGPLKGLGVVHFWRSDKFIDMIVSVGFKDVNIEKVLYTNNGEIIEMFVITAKKYRQ